MKKAKQPKRQYGEGGWERLEDAEELRRLCETCDSTADVMYAVGLAGGGSQLRKVKGLAANAKPPITLPKGRPGTKAVKLPVPDKPGVAVVGTEAWREARAENRILRQQVHDLRRRGQASICDWNGDVLRLGIVSDTHLGSLYENPDLLEAAYDVFAEERVDDVLHCGDLVDGEKMYAGHEYEIAVHGCDAQRNHVIKNYPQRNGLRTRFILGNHDYCYWKKMGVNIGESIAEHREDLEYLGAEKHDLQYGPITIRLQHPRGGSIPMGVSYKPQRIIESMSGGHKPHILALGHYHKSEVLPFYRNVYALQGGTTQSQTPFMAGKPTPAMMGFWVVTVHMNESGMGRVQDEWFPHFEEAA